MKPAEYEGELSRIESLLKKLEKSEQEILNALADNPHNQDLHRRLSRIRDTKKEALKLQKDFWAAQAEPDDANNGQSEERDEPDATSKKPRGDSPNLTTQELIGKIENLLKRHFFFRDWRVPLLIAVWVLGTYVYRIFTFFGYIWITSPFKRCGKSRLLDFLSYVCSNSTPRLCNQTEATIFREAHTGKTQIFDEVENLRDQDRDKYGALITILNAGFQADSKVPRMEKVGNEWQTTYYEVFSPKVLAGISRVADTIEDRSLKIVMSRKGKNEKVERFNYRKLKKEIIALKRILSAWGQSMSKELQQIYDKLDEVAEISSLDDRAMDIWEPLLCIATIADIEAEDPKRTIFNSLVSLALAMGAIRAEAEMEETAITHFVALARDLLGREEKIFVPTEDLIRSVSRIAELASIRTPKKLAGYLSKLDLHPRRDTSGKVRGYVISWEWLEDTENRYCPPPTDSEASEASESQSRSGSERDL